MPTHLIPAPAPVPATAPPADWLKLSAAITDQVGDLADRDDLTVTCAPGAGHGAPGCFIPALATIELDGTHLGHDPATCDPSRPSDRDRYPALWGVLVHESAHACHTRWTPPNDAPAEHIDAAIMLEESRIEAAHLRRRPADRRWLRACATHLILDDFAPPTPTPAPGGGTSSGARVPHAVMTPWDAARAAALLLARETAGVLDADETAALATEVTKILSPDRLNALAELWTIAHATADDDHTTMVDLGRRWCAILGADADQPATTDSTGDPIKPGDPSPLTAAITTTLRAVASTDAPPRPTGPDRAAARRREKDTRDHAEEVARRVFLGKPRASRRGRPPRPDEQAAARKLARTLKAAAHRERVTTTTTSAVPPGRLRMRGALAADAQRAAGATPTAEPFTRTTRRHVPAPPLRIGIACDVSGSMYTVAKPVASAAWILARAAAYVPDAISATVTFGNRVRPITYPGHAPTQVPEFVANDRTEEFVDAVDALDAALDLTRPGAARLLVVVSDGIFRSQQLVSGTQRINRLLDTGCGVLWLTLSHTSRPLPGAHPVALTDPAAAAAIIGTAATRALRAT